MKTKQNRDANAFLKQVQKNAQLREQLSAIKMTDTNGLEEIVRIATAAGFNFTAKEYEDAARVRLAAKGPAGCQFTAEQLISAARCMN
ncbi:MAG TPA: Nif11-like leader peptide family natural product precursor [Pirellulales bacterium]|jgi:predicted ribosomally synthesized peptide with nif11-like leader|nr:Nif11-like leader peptide family natural product precursor [Pirellulales bacterium]